MGGTGGPLERQVREVFQRVVSMKMPLAEMIDFVFAIDHCPIALREMMVRHRIGHKFTDVIENLPDSSFWSQTSRVMPMDHFFDEGEFFLPENAPPSFENMMREAQENYAQLVSEGMQPEEARFVIPLGAQHGIIWKSNLAAFQHVLARRSCWITQLGLWEPLVSGIVSELCEKIDPVFRMLARPPCIGSDDKFQSCHFGMECERRIDGSDLPLSPCPLYIEKHADRVKAFVELTVKQGKPIAWDGAGANPVYWESKGLDPSDSHRIAGKAQSEFKSRVRAYGQFWGHDPFTWQETPKAARQPLNIGVPLTVEQGKALQERGHL